MIDISINDMHETCMVKEKVIRPGDYLYIFVFHGCDGIKSFYVKALVDEVIYIWAHPKFKDRSIWHHRYLSGEEFLYVATEELDKLGWPINRKVPQEEFEALRSTGELKLYNQMPWVDWPIGHAAYVGDDGFFTLEDARKKYGRCGSAKRGRRIKQYLRRYNHPLTPWRKWLRKAYT